MQTKNLKIIGLTGLCCTVFLLLFVRCIFRLFEPSPRDKLLQYMQERYPDDSFTWDHNELGAEGKNTAETFEIILHSDKFPDAEIRAARWKVNGEFVYHDNYMAYYLEDDVNAYMHDLAKACFGECKVYVHLTSGPMVSSAFPTEAAAEDYLKSKPSCTFAVLLPPAHLTMEEAKEGLEKLKAEYEARQFEKVGAGVYVLPDAECYEKTHSIYGPDDNGRLDYMKDGEFVGGISIFD